MSTPITDHLMDLCARRGVSMAPLDVLHLVSVASDGLIHLPACSSLRSQLENGVVTAELEERRIAFELASACGCVYNGPTGRALLALDDLLQVTVSVTEVLISTNWRRQDLNRFHRFREAVSGRSVPAMADFWQALLEEVDLHEAAFHRWLREESHEWLQMLTAAQLDTRIPSVVFSQICMYKHPGDARAALEQHYGAGDHVTQRFDQALKVVQGPDTSTVVVFWPEDEAMDPLEKALRHNARARGNVGRLPSMVADSFLASSFSRTHECPDDPAVADTLVRLLEDALNSGDSYDIGELTILAEAL